MKLPCAVVRDILPLYAEKMVETETQALVEEHLADCPDCREKLSELNTDTGTTVETAEPLQLLKKQIRKRRWFAAAIAALCVFVVLFTYSCHQNSMRLVPWEEGLIEVKGIEARPYSEVYGEDAVSAETQDTTVDVLVFMEDSRINGIHTTMIPEDDGTKTLIWQGWTSNPSGLSKARDYNEQTFCPIPDRVIYDGGNQQMLLWGKPLNGGAEILPRLVLSYYVMAAAVMAAALGVLWFAFRSRNAGKVLRQLFFAPVSYVAAHLLIKGFNATSFFLEDDLIRILVLTAAIYALLSLAWQVWMMHRQEK